jgi:hypothetical protein
VSHIPDYTSFFQICKEQLCRHENTPASVSADCYLCWYGTSSVCIRRRGIGIPCSRLPTYLRKRVGKAVGVDRGWTEKADTSSTIPALRSYQNRKLFVMFTFSYRTNDSVCNPMSTALLKPAQEFNPLIIVQIGPGRKAHSRVARFCQYSRRSAVRPVSR